MHLRTLGFIRLDSILRDLFLFACGHPDALRNRFLALFTGHLRFARKFCVTSPKDLKAELGKSGDARLFGKSGERSFGICSARVGLREIQSWTKRICQFPPRAEQMGVR